MGPQVEALVRKKEGARLLVVDIDSWGSDVAKQYTVTSLPALWLYEDGKRVSTDGQQILDRLASE